MSQDGTLFLWNYSRKPPTNGDLDLIEDEEVSSNWRIVGRHYFMQNNAKVKAVAFHPGSNLLVAGFSNGLFGLYELPEFNMIHTLRYAFSRLIMTKAEAHVGCVVSHRMKSIS